ncbi:MAG: two-component sensor histidine kinase, partial [Lachnospiraceae bacterium]|nr:two-component sensor histidine kinase [Lachnospiraceae bacterium]
EKISYEIRYGNEEVKRDLIPRLLIEPLVENAVSHGLEPKEENGNILVDIYEQEEELHIIVEDNGVGFEPGELTAEKQWEEKPGETGHTHTGLENTRRLLHILYGNACRMELTGRMGEGTRVEIVLPIERSGEDVESDGGG